MVRFLSPPPPLAFRHHPSGTKSLWLLRARVLGVPHTVSPRFLVALTTRVSVVVESALCVYYTLRRDVCGRRRIRAMR